MADIQSTFSEKTVYDANGEDSIEYHSADGTTFYKDKKGVFSGKWFVNQNQELCYSYPFSDKNFCGKVVKKGDSIIRNNNIYVIKSGDVDSLRELYLAKEDSDFDAAKKANTVAIYDAFVKNYPNSKYIQEINSLNEAALLAQAKATDTAEIYGKFLKKYPDSNHTEEILLDWARKTGTTDAYDKFLEKYPKSKYAKSAIKEKKNIAKEKAKEEARLAKEKAREEARLAMEKAEREKCLVSVNTIFKSNPFIKRDQWLPHIKMTCQGANSSNAKIICI